MSSIYLDYNASAPLREEAKAAWLFAQEQQWGNPNSTHAFGQEARHAFDAARNQLAQQLGCKGFQIVQCGSGSEANALAIHAAQALNRDGKILCSAIEHSSVLRNAETAGNSLKIRVNTWGQLDLNHLAELVDESVSLVCFQIVNNEIGVVQDYSAIISLVREKAPQALILADACQAYGKVDVAAREADFDFLSFSARKFGGPKGIGFLYIKNGVRVAPLIAGGRQQQDRRSGTEDVAGICAAAAAAVASYAQAEELGINLKTYCAAAREKIQNELPDAKILSHPDFALAGTLNIAHPNIVNTTLMIRLDLAGYCVSPGSACMAARGDASHVIAALGLEKSLAKSAIRMSAGYRSTEEDVLGFADAYVTEVKRLLK